MKSLTGFPLEEALDLLKNNGYKVTLRELFSPRSRLYTKKCVLRAEYGEDMSCVLYWASFLELENTGEADGN